MIDLGLVKNRLRKDEGERLKPYIDTTGNVTIGVGRNLTAKGISEQESDLMLSEDIEEALTAAEKYDWFIRLDPVRQLVVICMIFNLGPGAFAGFKDTIMFISAGNYGMAAADMLQSTWARQVGQRAQAYAIMMRSGAML